MNQLTAAEKDRLAKQLAYGAIVGGWFLVGMGIFLGGLMFIVAPLLSDIPLGPEVAGPMSMLALAFIGGGWWMIRRRLHFRRLLDGPLLSGRAEVTAISTPAETENGWGIVLRVITPSGLEAEGGLTSYNTPSWSVGDQIELYFLDDEERFFPVDLDLNASLGQIVTTEGRERATRINTVVWIILGILAAIGFAFGIADSLAN